MTSYRCAACRTLLFRGLLVVARVELKCSRCNHVNNWEMGDVPRFENKRLAQRVAEAI